MQGFGGCDIVAERSGILEARFGPFYDTPKSYMYETSLLLYLLQAAAAACCWGLGFRSLRLTPKT